MEKFGRTVERYRPTPVTLRFSPTDVLSGIQFWEYPVDVPPLVEAPAVGVTLYREVWERRGWAVEDARVPA